MEQRKDSRAGNGKNRHRFSRAINGRSPFLPQQKQNCGDERTGVSDTDPPDEIGNVPGPAGGTIVAPDANAAGHQVGKAPAQQHEHGACDADHHPPGFGCTFPFGDATDLLGDVVIRHVSFEHGRIAFFANDVRQVNLRQFSHYASSGFVLRILARKEVRGRVLSSASRR